MDPATPEIYPLSLHDALPISEGIAVELRSTPRTALHRDRRGVAARIAHEALRLNVRRVLRASAGIRSEEHTSELQSRVDLVCRLLLEKKKLRYLVHSQSDIDV